MKVKTKSAKKVIKKVAKKVTKKTVSKSSKKRVAAQIKCNPEHAALAAWVTREVNRLITFAQQRFEELEARLFPPKDIDQSK
jgi:hypothetical protein